MNVYCWEVAVVFPGILKTPDARVITARPQGHSGSLLWRYHRALCLDRNLSVKGIVLITTAIESPSPDGLQGMRVDGDSVASICAMDILVAIDDRVKSLAASERILPKVDPKT
jgi:hypothetical protein